MSQQMIKKHNFDSAKAKIQVFSKNLPANPEFKKVEDRGIFLKHRVTGEELNGFISSVQSEIINTYNQLRSIIKEFGEIYKAFDSLDNEYVSGISKTAEMAKETSIQAQKASEQALNASLDNNKTIKALQATVSLISSLKSDVELLKKTKLVNDDGTFTLDFYKEIEIIKSKVESLLSYGSLLESYRHLPEIDEIWDSVDIHKTQIKSIDDRLELAKESLAKTDKELSNTINTIGVLKERLEEENNRQQKEIEQLQSYKSRLESYKHLPEIDEIWDSVDIHKIQIKAIDDRLELAKESLAKTDKELSDSICDLTRQLEERSMLFKKRMKIAYFVSGGILFLALCHLILNLLGLI